MLHAFYLSQFTLAVFFLAFLLDCLTLFGIPKCYSIRSQCWKYFRRVPALEGWLGELTAFMDFVHVCLFCSVNVELFFSFTLE